MLKKVFIAGTTAVFLSAGTLAATTTTASATSSGHSYGHISGGGWFFGWGHWPRYKPYPWWNHQPKRSCAPQYKTVRYWKPYRGWVTYRVYTGTVCGAKPYHRKW